MWQKLSRYYPVRLEIIPLALIIFELYLVITSYPTLPFIIPTHFGVNGAADEWGMRSAILLLPVLGIFVYFLLSVFHVMFALIKDPKRFINLPKPQKDKMTPAMVEKLMATVDRCLFVMKILLVSLTLYNVYITIEVAKSRATGLGIWFWLILAGLIGTVLFMLWQTLRLTIVPGDKTSL
jgi:uncharacterized membrane protein